MLTPLLFILGGYLCGSVLFARLAVTLFGKTAILSESRDGNPGTANAFQYGGFWCGVLVLCGDLTKGFLPVQLCLAYADLFDPFPLLLPLALAAPVIGHTFPLFYRFRGGKGIAVTFGCLLGLWPLWEPVAYFALVFVFFSVILRVSPHFYRTVVTYLVTLALLVFRCPPVAWSSFLVLSCAVLLRFHLSKEERERMVVNVLWKS